MIHFKSCEWQNFLSTGNDPIKILLDRSPTTLIVGQNGAGKSTLLDALSFGLFGRAHRDINKAQLVNSINQKGSVVTVEFTTGGSEFKIVRAIKPNRFEIWQNGNMINQASNVRDYQQFLEQNILKLNHKSFHQVVVLGSSSFIPFMQLPAWSRRAVIEDLLDINIFSKMNMLLKERNSKIREELTDINHQIDIIKTKIDSQSKYIKNLQSLNKDQIEGKQSSIEVHKLEIKKLFEESKDLSKNLTASISSEEKQSQHLLKKVSEMNSFDMQFNNKIHDMVEESRFYEENDNCPTCTQPLELDFKGDKIRQEENKLTTLNDGMKKLIEEITKQEELISVMDRVSKKMYEMNVEVSKLETSIEELDKYSNNIHEEIKSLQNKQTDGKDIEKQLEQLKVDLEETKVERDKIIDQQKYVDVLRTILNDKGAKANIIRKYVPIMNTLINQYLQSMDFFISFHLDEEFNETVKSRFRDTFNYNNFSEGEKMRIDLALLFTWRQIAKMKNSVNTNLLVLDEIFDSSLDGQGTDDFFKIIKTMTKENIFIISHKGDILFDRFTNIIKFEKHQNFTQLGNI